MVSIISSASTVINTLFKKNSIIVFLHIKPIIYLNVLKYTRGNCSAFVWVCSVCACQGPRWRYLTSRRFGASWQCCVCFLSCGSLVGALIFTFRELRAAFYYCRCCWDASDSCDLWRIKATHFWIFPLISWSFFFFIPWEQLMPC